MIQIPLKKYPDYSFKITIDGDLYVFNIRWNDAYEFWALTIQDKNNVELMTNVRMVINSNLFHEKRGLGLPGGDLFLVNTQSTKLEAGFDNILDYALVYSE